MLDQDHNEQELMRRGFERLSNGVSRHRFLAKVAKVILAATATLAAGGLGTQVALATVGACCSCGSPKACSGCPSTASSSSSPLCPSASNYTLCSSSQCGYCTWASGYWCCSSGGATYYCADCAFYDVTTGHLDCSTACTCSVKAVGTSCSGTYC